MNIKKQLTGLWYTWNQNKIVYETKRLCGVTLLTTKGTIRSKADQDDAWFFQLAKHANVIYDIGANVGYTALLAMIQNPNREYILVDPNPKALAQTNYNLTANNLGFKAQYYTAFVSDKANQEVKFYTVGAGAAGSMHPDHAKSAAAVNAFQMVTTVTLDGLYIYYKLKPTLVKIDVEGAEGLVMAGACYLAQETQCAFFIEMHAVANLSMENNAQRMIDWCNQQQYTPWYLKTASILKTAETIKQRGKCHLLLLPKQMAYPAYLKDIKERQELPNHV